MKWRTPQQGGIYPKNKKKNFKNNICKQQNKSEFHVFYGEDYKFRLNFFTSTAQLCGTATAPNIAISLFFYVRY